ncbi:MAG TPA: hypothetical protein PLD82_09065, partial [Spirochaetota bacterium]|nr:hypothetical protein [Spirochaetota bacterium]
LGFLTFREFVRYTDSTIRTVLVAIFKHLRNATLWIALSVTVFAVYTYARSGQFPDFSGALSYIGIFYSSGLAMMPLPLFHTWELVAVIYIGAITLACCTRLFRGTRPAPSGSFDPAILLTLSLLGILLFSYYQGRSHDWNLYKVWWPAFIILTLATDRLWKAATNRILPFHGFQFFRLFSVQRAGTGRLFSLIASLSLLFLLAAALPSSAITGLRMNKFFKGRHSAKNRVMESEFAQSSLFIQSHTKPGEKVLIFSYRDASFHVQSRTSSPVPVPGMTELLLKSELDAILAYIGSGNADRFFVEPALADNALMTRAFTAGYWPLAFSPHNTIALFAKTNTGSPVGKPAASRLLPAPGVSTIEHFFGHGPFSISRDGVIAGLLGSTPKRFAPLDGFSIECTLTALPDQPSDAFLFGNPPRSGTPGGFLIQKQGTKPGEYALVWGHARSWQPRLLFTIPSGKKAHLVATGSKASGRVEVFVNGMHAGSARYPGMDISPDPILIGRIGNSYTPFAGSLHEIRLFNQVLDANQCRAMAAYALQSPD